MGPYWAKNYASSQALGEFITFHDADDWSHPRRISKQVKAFSQEQSRRLVTVSFNRVDPEGNLVLNRGREKRLCLATMMFTTEDFKNVFGGFDAVRFGADYELYCRAKKLFERDAIYNVADVMYFALSIPSSLSSIHEVRLDAPDGANEETLLSPQRKQYVEQFESWQSGNGEDLRIPFPLTRRRFEVDSRMDCLQGDLANRSVVATIASIPSRRESLRQVLERISPQVDAIGVYLNNYAEVPDFLSDPKVTVMRSQDYGDIADNAKFFFHELTQDAIHLTIDDDIDYPANYVDYLLTKLVQYDFQVVVGFHGVIFDPEFTRFLRNRYVYHFAESQNFDRLVNLLGTGTIMYDTRTITFSHKRAETTGMIDLWFARHAKLSIVPLVSVRRPQHFLKQIEQISSENLMGLARADDERHTKIVASAGSWHPRDYLTDLVDSRVLASCFNKDLFE
jgi:glycosyltransferase involved in cell wall biosynthesis